MSMLLFALVLNPLICLSKRQHTGIRTGLRTTKTAVVTYADDFTIFVKAPADIQIIGDLLLTYERATGACFNTRKPKTMAAGSWDIPMDMMDFPYYREITILAFRFTSTVARSQNVIWSRAVGKVKALARDAYGRDLCLKQRIHYVHNFLLSTQHRFSRPRRSTSDNS